MKKLIWIAIAAPLLAQTPKSAAPIDLTGTWVSIVTEDWRYRMLTAPRGDFYSLPINADARKISLAYTPTQADACKNYHAPTLLRVPTRVRIGWESDVSLKLETDAGKQTRLFAFASAAATPAYTASGATLVQPGATARTMQGISRAQWQTPQATRTYWQKVPAQDPNTPGFPGINMQGPPPAPDPRNLGGSLKVTTTNILPGFLRNNGVPFSESAVLTEYFDLHKEANGDQWIVVTSIADDPVYLDAPWVTTQHFRKEANATAAAKWDPQACELILPSN